MSETVKTKTFTDAFDALTEVQASKSPNTIAQWAAIRKQLEWFEKNCESLSDFEENFEGYWSRFKAYQGKNPKADGKPRKLGHARRYLVQALKRAERRKWVKKTFKKSDFDLFEATTSPGKHVEDDGIKKILQTLEEKPKIKLQVLMAVTMGMRKSEILKLSKPEIDWRKKVIRLDPNRLKTRQARKVDIPITLEVEGLLRQFFYQAKGQYIFPKIDTRTNGPKNPIILWNEPQVSNAHVWSMAKKISRVNCRFHDLRHTCASNMVSGGMPTIHITQLLGMSEAMLKNIYAHMQKDDQEKFRNWTQGRFNSESVSKAKDRMKKVMGKWMTKK